MPLHPLFPGSFDPPTLGHLDLIRRGLELFGRLTVGVGENTSKASVFSVMERIELLERCTESAGGSLHVVSFAGLVVDYCREHNHRAILRGIRSVADFEYENQMALTNRRLAGEIETLFLMPSLDYTYTSSSLIKEILANGGDVSPFLPAIVIERLEEKLRAS
ncbi:MAG: pantetheine-phosphate adenylyltransferase [Planctomycetota bacterium]